MVPSSVRIEIGDLRVIPETISLNCATVHHDNRLKKLSQNSKQVPKFAKLACLLHFCFHVFSYPKYQKKFPSLSFRTIGSLLLLMAVFRDKFKKHMNGDFWRKSLR